MNTQQQNDIRMMIGESTYNLRQCVILPMFNMLVELQEELELTKRKLENAENKIFSLEYPGVTYE